jgi:type I restriction enzyme R subunit
MYMRKALPNASFMAFTGTPLMGEERTKMEFGDYVSIYDFEQSVRDNATVKLYYENRRPDLQIVNPDLNKAIKAVIDDAGLNEEQEEQFYKEYASMYQIITRDDRLNKIAENVVEHFMGRGHMGKAMYAAVDKATAIKMYDKVQICWKKYQDKLKSELKAAKGNLELEAVLKEKLTYMEEADMAVVVSAGQNEIEDCKKKGAEIAKHRKRMNTEDLETKFKAVDSNLRIVFVCSMWIVGFDAKAVSTMYIDKILKEHTLMQTIARANRVFKDKNNGIIVDYIGIFTALQQALAMYGRVNAKGQIIDDNPAVGKEELVKLLEKCSLKNTSYCKQKNIDVEKIFNEKDNFKKIKLCDDAVEAVLSNEKSKEEFLNNVSELKKLFTAVLPDIRAEKYAKQVVILSILSTKVNNVLRKPVSKKEIEELAYQVGEILNKSIKISEYDIAPKGNFDLSTVDFELLQKRFAKDNKKTIIEQLKSGLRARIQRLMDVNKFRSIYLEKLEKILSQYNTSDIDLDKFFNELMDFAKELDAEEKRHISEGLTEEELAIFDILTKPAPDLTKKDIEKVRKTSKDLLETLKKGKLNAGWKRMQSARAKVKVAIDNVCGRDLPEAYVDNIYAEKCQNLYMHFFDNYQSSTQNTYSSIHI